MEILIKGLEFNIWSEKAQKSLIRSPFVKKLKQMKTSFENIFSRLLTFCAVVGGMNDASHLDVRHVRISVIAKTI